MYDTNENTVKSWLNYGRKNMRVILETLQKQNKSFLGIAIVPFFIWMFSGDIERATTVKAAEIAHTIILSEAPKQSAVAKTFLTSAKGKAVVGIVAVEIVVGGIALQANHSQNKPVHKPQIVHVKKDKKPNSKEEKVQAETAKEAECEHNWQPQYKAVHHAAITQTQTVVDQPAYDEPVYANRNVRKWSTSLGVIFDTEALKAVESFGKGAITEIDVPEKYQSSVVHHNAITHQEQITVQPAYDQQVLTGYTCSKCGATKTN